MGDPENAGDPEDMRGPEDVGTWRPRSDGQEARLAALSLAVCWGRSRLLRQSLRGPGCWCPGTTRHVIKTMSCGANKRGGGSSG